MIARAPSTIRALSLLARGGSSAASSMGELSIRAVLGGHDPPGVVLRGPTGRPRASAVDLDALRATRDLHGAASVDGRVAPTVEPSEVLGVTR